MLSVDIGDYGFAAHIVNDTCIPLVTTNDFLQITSDIFCMFELSCTCGLVWLTEATGTD